MAQTAYDYSALIDAVTQAYGRDVWNGITSQEAFYSADFASKITQVEGVSATYLKNGNVAYYTYADDVVGTATSVGNVVNSNVGSTALSTVVETPASVSVNASTGVVAAESGLKTVSAGSTVAATMGKVAVGVGAVAAGIQLGVAIDGALYNANPDFWDSQGMSAINPETWDSVCSTQGGKDVFNMVFGIDKDTGETQAYMDQNAFAQIAQYLAVMQAFDTSQQVTNYEGSYTPTLPIYPYTLPVTEYTETSLLNNGLLVAENSSIRWYFASSAPGCMLTYSSYNTIPSIVACSKDSGVNIYMYVYNYISGTGSLRSFSLNLTSLDNNRYYINNSFSGYPSSDSAYVINRSATQSTTSSNASLLALFSLFGTIEIIGGVEGITPQSGATTPSGITSDMSTADVIAQLQQLYPDLFTGAISNDVVQPDGTTQTFTYVPVPIPDSITQSATGEVQPTGGVDLSQDQSTVSETSPESLIATLMQIITAPDPVNPTQEEEPTNDFPDTGGGITPAIVTPTGSASALYSVYNPSQAELNSFGAWLWSNNFVDQILKVFNNPMEAIIGLHKVFATPVTSGSGDIKVGYLNSGVSTNLVSNQYTEINCGTVSLREYFGNVFDYLSTEVYAYLPFVGIVQLNTEDIMRGDITVKYKVDVITGACLCNIEVSRDLAGGQLYTYSGNCAVQYPLSSGSYMGIVSSMLGIAGAVVGTVASGGALAPMALGVGASALAGAKTHVQHSGSVSGNAGAMGIKKPYLIIRRPQTATANFFDSFNGVSYNEYKKLNTLSGFVKVAYANLENFTGTTEDENKEIETLLKGGVLL